MKQTRQRKRQHSTIKTAQLQIITALLLTIFISTSCATTTKRDHKVVRVLDAQYELLQNLKNERLDSKVAQKVSDDDSLSQAEMHLQKSIDALMQSNKSIKELMQHD